MKSMRHIRKMHPRLVTALMCLPIFLMSIILMQLLDDSLPRISAGTFGGMMVMNFAIYFRRNRQAGDHHSK
ncbi:MAG: hypothetical protein ACOZAA_18720 [Pseudomonadota bacterium]